MKSNPLLLGNKKLHSATNLIFDEGVIRTRPGFRYESLGASGQFQGACEYRPQEGISSESFSDIEAGTAVVADGALWFRCNQLSQRIFDGAGSVHLYQAENYLVVQSPQTDTFWWDGYGDLVRSPGMQEQDWNDPEVPVQELEVVVPVADIPDCDVDGAESGIEVRFLVIDSVTEQPIENVSWTVKRHGRRAYWGVSGTDGRFDFRPIPRVYTYDLRVDGYTAIEDVPLEINGTGVERVWDDCLPPTIEIVGEYDYVVRMAPILSCGIQAGNMVVNEDFTSVSVTLLNSGELPVTIFSVVVAEADFELTPLFPIIIPVGESSTFTVTSETSLEGFSLSINTSCVSSDTDDEGTIDMVIIDDDDDECVPPGDGQLEPTYYDGLNTLTRTSSCVWTWTNVTASSSLYWNEGALKWQYVLSGPGMIPAWVYESDSGPTGTYTRTDGGPGDQTPVTIS